jgi:hypothetical protein
MKNLFPLALMAMLLLATGKCFSQGCVAIRSTGATCALHVPDSVAMLSKWQLGSTTAISNHTNTLLVKKNRNKE